MDIEHTELMVEYLLAERDRAKLMGDGRKYVEYCRMAGSAAGMLTRDKATAAKVYEGL